MTLLVSCVWVRNDGDIHRDMWIIATYMCSGVWGKVNLPLNPTQCCSKQEINKPNRYTTNQLNPANNHEFLNMYLRLATRISCDVL